MTSYDWRTVKSNKQVFDSTIAFYYMQFTVAACGNLNGFLFCLSSYYIVVFQFGFLREFVPSSCCSRFSNSISYIIIINFFFNTINCVLDYNHSVQKYFGREETSFRFKFQESTTKNIWTLYYDDPIILVFMRQSLFCK